MPPATTAYSLLMGTAPQLPPPLLVVVVVVPVMWSRSRRPVTEFDNKAKVLRACYRYREGNM